MEKSIGKELRTISNLLVRQMVATARENGIPIPQEGEKCPMGAKKTTPMHGMFIGYIYKKDQAGEDVFQKDLENNFSIRRSTVSEILKLMEKNDLIVRTSVDHDARLKKITLTEKAKKEHVTIMESIKSTDAAMLNGMTDEEIEQLFILLEKVKKNLEN